MFDFFLEMNGGIWSNGYDVAVFLRLFSRLLERLDEHELTFHRASAPSSKIWHNTGYLPPASHQLLRHR